MNLTPSLTPPVFALFQPRDSTAAGTSYITSLPAPSPTAWGPSRACTTCKCALSSSPAACESHSVFFFLSLHGLGLVLPLLQVARLQPTDRHHPRQPGEPHEPGGTVSAASLPLLDQVALVNLTPILPSSLCMVLASCSHCCRLLRSNQLTGTIPSSICPLLTTGSLNNRCFLQDNSFSCPLPCRATAQICDATGT